MANEMNIAVVGGGLAGLATAYQILRKNPGVKLVVYERGSEESYKAQSDDSNRASLGASPARAVRLSGATEELDVWLVEKTLGMIRNLEKEIAANPKEYDDLQGIRLFYPEASVTLSVDKSAGKYAHALELLKKENVPYSEIRGRELKHRFPGVYNSVPDDTFVLVEEPADGKNAVSGLIDSQQLMHALRHYIKAHGGEIRYGEEVKRVADIGGKAVVSSSTSGEASYDKAVVAPGQALHSVLDTEKLGIRTRHERVVVMDIDLKAMGAKLSSVPLTRGDYPPGGAGSVYSFMPDSKQGHVKFLAKDTTKTLPYNQLHQPVSDAEKELALKAASARFNIPVEALAPHVSWSHCVYTYPEKGKGALVGQVSDHIVVNAVDSSSSARRIGGLGKIAAALVMEKREPFKGSYAQFGLEAHHRIVQGLPAVPAPEVPKIMRDEGPLGGLKAAWNSFLKLVGFETVPSEMSPAQKTPMAVAADTTLPVVEPSATEERHYHRERHAQPREESPVVGRR